MHTKEKQQSHVEGYSHRACTNGCRKPYGEQHDRGTRGSEGGDCLCTQKKNSRAMWKAIAIVPARMDAGSHMASKEAEEPGVPKGKTFRGRILL